MFTDVSEKTHKELKVLNLENYLNSPKIINIGREKTFLSKLHTCSKCGLSYSFGHLIKHNLLSRSCRTHVGEFNKYTCTWTCCNKDYYNPGCLYACHDTENHFLKQKVTDFPYFMKQDTELFKNVSLNLPLLQISLSSWIILHGNDMELIKKSKKDAKDILIFDTKEEIKNYLDSFDNTSFKKTKTEMGIQFITLNKNNNFFKNIKSNITLDSPTIYLEDVNYDTLNKSKNDNNTNLTNIDDDDFLKYSIIRLPLYDCEKSNSKV